MIQTSRDTRFTLADFLTPESYYSLRGAAFKPQVTYFEKDNKILVMKGVGTPEPLSYEGVAKETRPCHVIKDI